ncbi:MAG: hypothetical protein SGJ13_02550 [Actinomycetota bacterium]|nr:hypothetical protein [Actinomycetota bacterium]
MRFIWCARVAWAVLPLTAGDALAAALDDWSRAPALLAAACLWSAWAVGLIALLAPRPWGLTVLRIVAPAAVGAAVTAAFSASGTSAALAIGSTFVAAVLALSAPVTEAAGNALVYGDEARFALRIPTPLLLAPVPLAIAFVVGAVSGPLFLAAGWYVAGAIVCVVGIPLAFVLVRSLHALARRWLVLVPAGLVVLDPLTLADPVLIRRELIVALGSRAPETSAVVDLRLGTRGGSVAITTHEPIELVRRSGRAEARIVPALVVLVSPLRTAALLETAAARRIPVT